jgi:ribosomal protein S18 acetylase RimI-like enzyme
MKKEIQGETAMELLSLSKTCSVRRLQEDDLESIYALCASNPIFYQYHPPFVTRERICADLQALPPQVQPEDKYFLGFWRGDALVCVMDLILGYPQKEVAYIGLFMMDAQCQGKGIGSQIVTECADWLRSSGFAKIRLGVDKDNPQSNAFWKKNGFRTVSEETYRMMEREL